MSISDQMMQLLSPIVGPHKAQVYTDASVMLVDYGSDEVVSDMISFIKMDLINDDDLGTPNEQRAIMIYDRVINEYHKVLRTLGIFTVDEDTPNRLPVLMDITRFCVAVSNDDNTEEYLEICRDENSDDVDKLADMVDLATETDALAITEVIKRLDPAFIAGVIKTLEETEAEPLSPPSKQHTQERLTRIGVYLAKNEDLGLYTMMKSGLLIPAESLDVIYNILKGAILLNIQANELSKVSRLLLGGALISEVREDEVVKVTKHLINNIMPEENIKDIQKMLKVVDDTALEVKLNTQ